MEIRILQSFDSRLSDTYIIFRVSIQVLTMMIMVKDLWKKLLCPTWNWNLINRAICISYYGTQRDIGIKCDKILKGKGIDVHKSTQAGFYQEYPEVYESVKASDFRWYGEMDMKIINSGDHSNLGKNK